MMDFALPCIYDGVIYPKRNRTTLAQRFIIIRPVSYLLFCFTDVTTVLAIKKDFIAGFKKGSIDLGNNAARKY